MGTNGVTRRHALGGGAATVATALLGGLGASGERNAATAPSGDPAQLDLRDAALAVRARSISPVELTRACSDRIARLDTRLNSFITVTAERALADALRAEDEIAKGRWRGPGIDLTWPPPGRPSS